MVQRDGENGLVSKLSEDSKATANCGFIKDTAKIATKNATTLSLKLKYLLFFIRENIPQEILSAKFVDEGRDNCPVFNNQNPARRHCRGSDKIVYLLYGIPLHS